MDLTGRTETERSRPIPFLLAAVSVCDIQAFTEHRFAKKEQTEKTERQTERLSHKGRLMLIMHQKQTLENKNKNTNK